MHQPSIRERASMARKAQDAAADYAKMSRDYYVASCDTKLHPLLRKDFAHWARCNQERAAEMATVARKHAGFSV